MISPAFDKVSVWVGGALFSAEGKLLLVQRRAVSAEPGEWELPGGVLEFGESPELGLVRSFSEVTGIEISVDRPLGAWSSIRNDSPQREHAVHINYTVRHSSAILGVETDQETFAAFGWVAQAEALSRVDSPSIKSVVERAFATLARSRKSM